MFNRCAINALLGRPGRMRKVKCDNRNEGKGHFLCPAPGTDAITAAYHLVRTVRGSTVGHNAGEYRVKLAQLRYRYYITGEKACAPSTIIPCLYYHTSCHVCHLLCKYKAQMLSNHALAGEVRQEIPWGGWVIEVTINIKHHVFASLPNLPINSQNVLHIIISHKNQVCFSVC